MSHGDSWGIVEGTSEKVFRRKCAWFVAQTTGNHVTRAGVRRRVIGNEVRGLGRCGPI